MKTQITEMKNLECITLFVEDLAKAKKFYEEVFAVKLVFEDPNCSVFRLENVMINLLNISESPELIVPAKVGDALGGARMMFTINVPNADFVCEKLRAAGVTLLNGPIDRPWGRRTAAFQDPAGNAWEIAQEL